MSIKSHAHAPTSSRARSTITRAPDVRKIQNTTPFPSHGDAETYAAWEAQADAQRTPRTVRRKKSSFDLRDVFKNGGVIPSQTAVSML